MVSGCAFWTTRRRAAAPRRGARQAAANLALLGVAAGLVACEPRVVSLLPLTTEPNGSTPEQPTGPPPAGSSPELLDAAAQTPGTPTSEPPTPVTPTPADPTSSTPEAGLEPALDASTAPDGSIGEQPDAGVRLDAGNADNNSLLHRYEFAGSGTEIIDSVGSADGDLLGGAELADGAVRLDGVDDYVRLPSGLISKLEDATFMVWATWHSDRCWERLFDFGTGVVVGETTVADTTLFLTPLSCQPEAGPAAYLEFRGELAGQQFGHEYLFAEAAEPIGIDSRHQFTVVIDQSDLLIRLYIDGVFVAEGSLLVGDSGVAFLLSNIADGNNWLGRSQYDADAYLNAELEEFRIYAEALSEQEIQKASFLGPDLIP